MPAESPSPRAAVPWRRLLVALALPALALRLLTLVLTAGDPLVQLPFQDGLSYAKWALEISQGDWLGTRRPVFYQAPLYPYVLAVLQSAGLGFWPWPQLLHALAGTGAVVFVFLATHRLFGEKPAWIAGGALAAWGPALMYEMVLDKVALGLLVTAAACWVLVVLHERVQNTKKASATGCLAAGLLLGAGAMLRENLLVLVPVTAAFLWLRTLAWKAPAAVIAGTVLGLAPVWLHNLVIGGELLPTTYQAGTNFWIGNHGGAEGTYEPLLAGRGDPVHEERDAVRLAAAGLGRPAGDVSPGQVNRFWIGKSLGWAASDPFAWFGLQLRKLQWFAFHAEAPDSVPYDGFRSGRPWMLPSRLLFGLLFPLALLGLWLTGRRADVRFFASLGVAACGSVILFYVVSRYRLACVPFLLSFAAHAALECVRRPKLLVAVAVLAIPSQLWLPQREPAGLDAKEQQATLWVNRGTALASWTKQDERAIGAWQKALALVPDLLPAHTSLARTFLKHRAYDRALPHCEATVLLAPIDVEARHNLGFCLIELGELARAERELRRIVESKGAEAPRITVQQLARCLRRQGKEREARAVIARFGAPGK